MTLSAWQAAVFGVVQGLTEFLPVSSSAHLILLPRFMGWPDPGLAFDVAMHMGTLAAVFTYFWKDLWQVAQGVIRFRDPFLNRERRLAGHLVLATIPGAAAGFFLEHQAETLFRSPGLIAITLSAMGAALLIADRLGGEHRRIPNLRV